MYIKQHSYDKICSSGVVYGLCGVCHRHTRRQHTLINSYCYVCVTGVVTAVVTAVMSVCLLLLLLLLLGL